MSKQHLQENHQHQSHVNLPSNPTSSIASRFQSIDSWEKALDAEWQLREAKLNNELTLILNAQKTNDGYFAQYKNQLDLLYRSTFPRDFAKFDSFAPDDPMKQKIRSMIEDKMTLKLEADEHFAKKYYSIEDSLSVLDRERANIHTYMNSHSLSAYLLRTEQVNTLKFITLLEQNGDHPSNFSHFKDQSILHPDITSGKYKLLPQTQTSALTEKSANIDPSVKTKDHTETKEKRTRPIRFADQIEQPKYFRTHEEPSKLLHATDSENQKWRQKLRQKQYGLKTPSTTQHGM